MEIQLGGKQMKIGYVLALCVALSTVTLTSVNASDFVGLSDDPVPVGEKFDFASYGVDESFDPEEFGLVDDSILAVNSFAFNGFTQADDGFLTGQSGVWRFCTSNCLVVANLQLPSGAKINAIEADLRDTSNTGSVSATIYRCPIGASGCIAVATVSTGAAETPGVVQLMTTLDLTVLNGLETYIAAVAIGGDSSTTAFQGFRVFSKRQISPAPGVATFGDVSLAHPFFANVEALAASGITGGCGGGNYCPDQPVTRGQMAAFLSRALGLHWDGY